MAIVRDYRILKALERRGFIVCKDGSSRHWMGHTVRNYFVDSGPNLANWYDRFEYAGKVYKIEYFDGCFHPFVVEEGKAKPSFV
jgi:hypothetical protein